MPYEYLCDAHINKAEELEDEPEAFLYWMRYTPEADPAYRCEHPDHAIHEAGAEAEAAPATWICYSRSQLEFLHGALPPEPALTPSAKLDEILRLLKADNPAITITYKTSSQPKGQDGIEIRLTERAEAADIIRIADAAEAEFFKRKAALNPNLTTLLAQSLKPLPDGVPMSGDSAPPSDDAGPA